MLPQRAKRAPDSVCRSRSKPRPAAAARVLRVARSLDEIESAFETARREAEAYFKNGTIYAERYLENPKAHRTAGPRRQARQRRARRRTRLLAAAPPPKTLGRDAGTDSARACAAAMREAGIRAAKAIGYDSRRNDRMPRRRRRVLLPRNEHAHSGRAHRHARWSPASISFASRFASRPASRSAYDQERFEFRGYAIEVARQRRGSRAKTFGPHPGTITRVPRTRRPRRARRLGRLRGLDDSARVRFADRQAHRLGADARTSTSRGCAARSTSIVIDGVPTTMPLLRALCDEPIGNRQATYGTATLEAFAARNGRCATPRPASECESIDNRLDRRRIVEAPADAPQRAGRPRGSTRSKDRRRNASGNAVIAPMHGVDRRSSRRRRATASSRRPSRRGRSRR